MRKDLVQDGKNPVYFCRFEDCIADPAKELDGIFRFLLDLDDLEGTNIQRRIIKACKKPESAGKVYEIKASTKIGNSQAKRYTAAQVAHVKETNASHLHYFGYASAPEGFPENTTSFVAFDSDRSQSLTDEYYGFRRENEKQIAKVLEISKDPTKVQRYNRNGEHIDLTNLPGFQMAPPMEEYYNKKFYDI